jgi:hypothetical protein
MTIPRILSLITTVYVCQVIQDDIAKMKFRNVTAILVRMVSVVDRGFELRSGQTKDYTIGLCCFSAKYAALRSVSKDWLARNKNNVSE